MNDAENWPMAQRLDFSVPLVAGKARPRVTACGTYTPRATLDAEDEVITAFRDAANARARFEPAPKGCPVGVWISVQRAMPESRPKSRRYEQDVYKPDPDNIAKLVLDALNGEAWADDAQVVELAVRKVPRRRGQSDMTHVRIEWPHNIF